ncbi:MAG: hypothetical protein ABIQ95_06685 [Bdellovibrionia bacterium]
MKKLAILAMFGIALSTTQVRADEASDKQHDCILMTGAQVAAAGLSLSNGGSGHLEYWLRTFELLRSNANAISASLQQNVIPSIKSPFLSAAMGEIIKDIQSALQEGGGDAEFWWHETSEQIRIYGRAAEKIKKMKELACS